jgi:hypothetical protein
MDDRIPLTAKQITTGETKEEMEKSGGTRKE